MDIRGCHLPDQRRHPRAGNRAARHRATYEPDGSAAGGLAAARDVAGALPLLPGTARANPNPDPNPNPNPNPNPCCTSSTRGSSRWGLTSERARRRKGPNPTPTPNRTKRREYGARHQAQLSPLALYTLQFHSLSQHAGRMHICFDSLCKRTVLADPSRGKVAVLLLITVTHITQTETPQVTATRHTTGGCET